MPIDVIQACSGERVCIMPEENAQTLADLKAVIKAHLEDVGCDLRLMANGSVIDSDSLLCQLVETASCDEAETITLFVTHAGPSWYPLGKYLHEGKNVRRMVWSGDTRDNNFRNSFEIEYVDGTNKLETCKNRPSYESSFRDMAKQFQFEYEALVGRTSGAWTCTAVPPEDPDIPKMKEKARDRDWRPIWRKGEATCFSVIEG